MLLHSWRQTSFLRFHRYALSSLRHPSRLLPCMKDTCWSRPGSRFYSITTSRFENVAADNHPSPKAPSPSFFLLKALPYSCPGCGAPTQWVDENEPGFYTSSRSVVKAYASFVFKNAAVQSKEVDDAGNDIVYEFPLDSETGSGARREESNGKNDSKETNSQALPEVPVCDRCHNLIHHHQGVSIEHPPIDVIHEIIDESPHRYNHVYHILDAADFPMSLIPNLQHKLSLASQRSKNRRSKIHKFIRGRRAEISFVISRSDLLAPTKEQVDRMMPWLTQVLRDALGRSARNVRLGNVYCVSAKRAWWTKQLKDHIYKRGGGAWIVGKVNVGKSKLIENVYPKGQAQDINMANIRTAADVDSATLQNSYLPPEPQETPFPTMPAISSIPGTTASPIRLPFGHGKGELIDLPGLDRSSLAPYVLPSHRLDTIMTDRIKPTQQVLKPGQSLLLAGGLVRVTPIDVGDDNVVLAYNFTPLSEHVTSTAKAVAITTQDPNASKIPSIMVAGVSDCIASAGRFSLQWDVTARRSGPLVKKNGMGIKTEDLPFKIFSADILIESCGWVELVCQVRRRIIEERERLYRETPTQTSAEDEETLINLKRNDSNWYPTVEIFTPKGRYIGIRRPMNAYLLVAHKPGKPKLACRPKRSMKGMKKLEKKRKRMQSSATQEVMNSDVNMKTIDSSTI